jgi:hypothetical protein
MPALRLMARQELVQGMLNIEGVDQLCDASLVDKQRRSSFPS